MSVEKLLHWVEIQKLKPIDKRDLANELFKQRLGFICEWQLYQYLQRLGYLQSFKWSTKPDIKDAELLQVFKELGLKPSTVLGWYYRTFKQKPIRTDKIACVNCRFNKACEYLVDPSVKDQIIQKYNYKLVLKRLKQFIVKRDIFHKFAEEILGKISYDQVSSILRKLVEFDYYYGKPFRYKKWELSEIELKMREILKEYGIKPITALRYYYILKNPDKLLRQAQINQIDPNEVMQKAIEELKKELHEVRL